MQELTVDFITSLDGYGAAEGWLGWWGLQSPEYLAGLVGSPESGVPRLAGGTPAAGLDGPDGGDDLPPDVGVRGADRIRARPGWRRSGELP